MFIAGMFIFIRYDTPMFLITQKRYKDAQKSISHFSGKNEKHDEIFEYLKKTIAKDTNSVTYKQALCEEKYRRTTWITLVFNLSTVPNGIFMITSLGGVLFSIIYDGHGG